ncbi:MAG TPA: tetratricopeptide repeat protein [Polyangia bacterium]|jgi:predicted Zn-dependent protease|nr:tetratricopeptide repeat protein [Polyangia bacterium]
MRRFDLVVHSAIAVLTMVFVVGVVRTTDPAQAKGTLHPTDARLGHVGGLSFAESEALVQRLRARRSAETNPDRRAVYSAQLSDLLVQRLQHKQALAELDEALRLFPDRPELLARAALLHFALEQPARAQAALQAARSRAPDLPLVQRAAAIIEGKAPARVP